jgi:hypothetical protein
MYLVNNARPDIAFKVNLLIRYSTTPIIRHWNRVKDVLWYLWGTPNMSLFYLKNQNLSIIGYVNIEYLSDLHNDKSQTTFIFLHGGTTISWKSCKQTLIGTSTNHSEIITLYEATCECAWLYRVINHIQVPCDIKLIGSPIIIYEDNTIYITQIQSCYVKSNIIKHITLKLFHLHKL